MALVDYRGFNQFKILFGDGADPEVFATMCTLNSSRGLSSSAETTDRNIPDCDDDLLPSATLRYPSAISHEISGSGVLEAADAKEFADWLASGAPKNIRIELGTTGGTRWSGAFVITSFNITAETKDVVNAEITLASHGAVTTAVIS